MLRILADENIPGVTDLFSSIGSVRTRPGRAISKQDVETTDILLVRSVTPVSNDLVANSPVQFVGTATIGTDHVDVQALAQRGIRFAHAPGSNAESVVEYILAALYEIAAQRGEQLAGKTIGVIGCGAIGGRLLDRLPVAGFRVLANDPPLQRKAEARNELHNYVSIEQVVAESDIITLHVPLTHEGEDVTYHLFDADTLAQCKMGVWILNACRGAVIDNMALLEAVKKGAIAATVLDVWENEPKPNQELVQAVDLATPHIAGYSYDGKINGTIQLYEAVCDHLGMPVGPKPLQLRVLTAQDERPLMLPSTLPNDQAFVHALVRQLYDISADHAWMQATLSLDEHERAAAFIAQRKAYPRRRGFQWYQLPSSALTPHQQELASRLLGLDLIP